MSHILVIDSGNSFIKWGLSANKLWVNSGKISFSDVTLLKEEFDRLPKPEMIIVSHVARADTKNKLDRLLSIWPVKPYWLVSQASQCHVCNSYADPAQLGSDRWAALIAAWDIYHRPCLVISVGTAMTIDALSESGKFIGGIIIPGKELMLKGLWTGTHLKNAADGNYQDFPQNTQDAIESGMIQCLVGAIDRMNNLLSMRLGRAIENSIITGGGASKLLPFINIPVKQIDNLVLEGLVLIAKDLQITNSFSPLN